MFGHHLNWNPLFIQRKVLTFLKVDLLAAGLCATARGKAGIAQELRRRLQRGTAGILLVIGQQRVQLGITQHIALTGSY